MILRSKRTYGSITPLQSPIDHRQSAVHTMYRIETVKLRNHHSVNVVPLLSYLPICMVWPMETVPFLASCRQ